MKLKFTCSLQVVLFISFGIPKLLWASGLCAKNLREVKIVGTELGDLADYKLRLANERMPNHRTLLQIIKTDDEMYHFFNRNLDAETVVVDLGAGAGVAVAAAAHTLQYMGLSEHVIETPGEKKSILLADLDLESKLRQNGKFLGITGSDESNLLVPAVDPAGRYRILHSRIFEEIPLKELDEAILLLSNGVRKKVLAYSVNGMLERTPTPDLAFEKAFQMLRLGDRLYFENRRSHLVQDESGALISLSQYAERCGFELIRRGNGIGGAVLVKSKEDYTRIPLTLVSGNFARRPYYFFRMQPKPIGEQEKLDLDIAALRAIAAKGLVEMIPGLVQISDHIKYQLNRPWPEAEYRTSPPIYRWSSDDGMFRQMSQFANRLQGFDPRAVAKVFPGEISQTFSGWVVNHRDQMAVDFFDSHREAFQFDSEYTIFFVGLRDILNKETQTMALTRIEQILREYRPYEETASKAENMGEFLYSILCSEVLELPRERGTLALEKISRNQAINSLSLAWIYSRPAVDWLRSHKFECIWDARKGKTKKTS